MNTSKVLQNFNKTNSGGGINPGDTGNPNGGNGDGTGGGTITGAEADGDILAATGTTEDVAVGGTLIALSSFGMALALVFLLRKRKSISAK